MWMIYDVVMNTFESNCLMLNKTWWMLKQRIELVLVTCDLWLVTCGLWLVTCDLFLVWFRLRSPSKNWYQRAKSRMYKVSVMFYNQEFWLRHFVPVGKIVWKKLYVGTHHTISLWERSFLILVTVAAHFCRDMKHFSNIFLGYQNIKSSLIGLFCSKNLWIKPLMKDWKKS